MSTIDPKTFRETLGTFCTVVTVVTTLDGDRPTGATANSFTSVSLDPPLILVCFGQKSSTLGAVQSSGAFAVNILSDQQRAVASAFASKGADKFAGIAWRAAATGAPILPGSIGWLDCRVHDVVRAGDHDVVLGQVVALDHSPARPLGYFRGSYTMVSLEQEVGEAYGTTLYAAIIDSDGAVLLARPSVSAAWHFPTARSIAALTTALSALGTPAVLDFLFSVAELPDGRGTSIVYRGALDGVPGSADPDRVALFRRRTSRGVRSRATRRR